MRFVVILLVFTSAIWATTIDVKVDARNLMRGLLSVEMEMPAPNKELILWYPKWIPGIHGPRGPIENMGGLVFRSFDNKVLVWRRDLKERFRFICQIPKGIKMIKAGMNYICNQPSVNSKGIDSYGNFDLGVINWNTCILYPEGIDNDKLMINLKIRFPAGWKYATAMEATGTTNNWVEFQQVTLQEFIDSPLICGRYLRSYSLPVKNFPPHYIHVVSEADSATKLDKKMITKYKNLVRQSKRLFQKTPYRKYHFLVVASDQVPGMGLEHLSSSLNGVPERAYSEKWTRKGRVGSLLAHEQVHAWCGKYRRPKGMYTPNYHTAKDTKLLWIYEGLTTYWGEVLYVRSGFLPKKEYVGRLSNMLNRYEKQKGRYWRSLEDTAICTFLLRGGSRYWGVLRRGQDYYREGLLLWLEIDAMIRQKTQGKKSLDDLAREFFGDVNPKLFVKPFDLKDIIVALDKLAAHDWQGLFQKRVLSILPNLPLEVADLCGYRVTYKDTPSAYFKEAEKRSRGVSAVDSLGLSFNSKGIVRTIIPGMPGETHGFLPGMQVIGVNGKKFSPNAVKDALADSTIKKAVEFLVWQGDNYRTILIDYKEGLKYFRLQRNPKKKDVLGEILSAKK